jgi:SAM-dependent methyltransferase
MEKALVTQELEFYERVDRNGGYGYGVDVKSHPFEPLLRQFIERWDLRQRRCLEIGSGTGTFQDIVEDYTGVDIASRLAPYYRKPFHAVRDARLPFPSESYDAVFAYATHEHIPDIEVALGEIVRVLKPGGVCLFAPAWHTRPWFAGGYAVRRFSELTLREKLIKASIPLRNHTLIRYPFVFLRRLVRLVQHVAGGRRPAALRYRKVKANYEKYWQSDSDACNSLDPFDVIVWFSSRGLVCRGYKGLLKALFVRTLALEIQKPMDVRRAGM